jgi:tRNA(Arg) A34 adenosine deaminase TadA
MMLLRWPTPTIPSPEYMDVHYKFMGAAMDMAETGLRTEEVPAGCVFVHNGEIISRAMNDINHSLSSLAASTIASAEPAVS